MGGRSDSELGQGQSLRILPSIRVGLVIGPSAEYGRTRRDLACARPFLGPYFLYII